MAIYPMKYKTAKILMQRKLARARLEKELEKRRLEKSSRKKPSISSRIKARWQRFKEWNTVDHWIDLCVDVGLVAFDVLSSPILLVVRFIRYFMNKWVNGYIKRFIKWFVHKVCRVP